jgi:hypothetical protein
MAAQASEAAKSIEINVADVIDVREPVDVVLSKEQRMFLKRGIEQVLAALHFVEVVVEVAPDGTVRVAARLRT